MGINFSTYEKTAIRASLLAGEAIRMVYDSAFDVESKSDNTPITLADKNAHDIIADVLSSTPYPVLSEEGIHLDYEERSSWEYYWLVDPLDGTREFVKRNGEFTVNIALMHLNEPIFGVIYAPILKCLFVGGPHLGAFKAEVEKDLPENVVWTELPIEQSRTEFIVLGSRSHAPISEKLQARLEKNHRSIRITPLGSSLKICKIAEGSADLYARLGPTMEWDTAAGDAICRAVGIPLKQYHTNENIQYNKPDLHNPDFYAGRFS